MAATGALVSAPAASAHPGQPESDTNSCNRDRDRLTLTGRLTGDHDNIRLTIRLRTTDRRADDGWTIRINQNGERIKTYNVEESDFDDTGRNRQVFVRSRLADNTAGPDSFRARAVNDRTGQDCAVRIVVRGHNNN